MSTGFNKREGMRNEKTNNCSDNHKHNSDYTNWNR